MVKRSVLVLLICTGLLGCAKEGYPLQARVTNVADAVDHCRGYSHSVLPANALLSVDHFSTREDIEHYIIFFDLSGANLNGYVRCQVTRRGLIVRHEVRNERR